MNTGNPGLRYLPPPGGLTGVGNCNEIHAIKLDYTEYEISGEVRKEVGVLDKTSGVP